MESAKYCEADPTMTRLSDKGMVGSFIQTLSERTTQTHAPSTEVLQLLAEGRLDEEAAFILNVTPRTVAFHKYTMMEHLRLRSSAELIQFAMQEFSSPA